MTSPSGSESHGFLGEEFLTWLWFRWETDGGEFDLTRERRVGVVLDDLLTFAAASDQDSEQTLRHGLPTRTPEARVALRAGRLLRKARLLIAEDQRQWQLTLDGSTMTPSSVRLPDDDEDADGNEEKTADRVANWWRLQEILQELYGVFLRERLQSDYAAGEGRKFFQWMASASASPRA